MIDPTIDQTITVSLAIIALLAYAALVALRIRTDSAGSRLLFMDVLLLIASVEVLADTMGAMWLARLTQGALMAGGVAMLLTFDRRSGDAHPDRERRKVRRDKEGRR